MKPDYRIYIPTFYVHLKKKRHDSTQQVEEKNKKINE